MTTRRLAVFLIATFVGAQALVLIALRGRYEDSGLLPIAWFAELSPSPRRAKDRRGRASSTSV